MAKRKVARVKTQGRARKTRGLGYLVIWKGAPMRQVARSRMTKTECDRLFYPSGYATVWATYSRARQAMVTAIRAWGKEDGMWWRVVSLRAQRAARSAAKGASR